MTYLISISCRFVRTLGAAILVWLMFIGRSHALVANVETGDPVIDAVQTTLAHLPSSRRASVDAELDEALSILFARPAFQDIRNEGWRYMLFTLVKTREVVLRTIPHYTNAKQRAGLAKIAQTMLELENRLVSLYGPNFVLAEHLNRYSDQCERFTQNLPTPSHAPTSRFFDQFDAEMRVLREQLKMLGLQD